MVTDYLGNALSESEFYPYGGEMQVLTGDSNTYKFTGKERDPESGLDNFGARYYVNNLGRFMSPDWDAKPTAVPYASFGDPQTLNLYSYVENTPLNRVDADGHVAATNLANNWIGLGTFPDWSLAVLSAWHAYCLGSGPFGHFGGEESHPDSFMQMDAEEEQETNAAKDLQDAQVHAAQQQSSGWTSAKPTSGDYVTVSDYSRSARGFHHTGIAVDSDDTQGFSTQNPKTPWWQRIFGAPKARMEDDLQMHTSPDGEVAPHSYLYHSITSDQASTIQGAIDARTQDAGRYNLIFRNCAGAVESFLHAGGVSGVPHGEIFIPAVLHGVLELESR
ncbi:MAG: RHS repeat-associated core domain-containing protein [Terracidiphilus sp.]